MLGLAAVACGLCLYRLGGRSIWLDEAAAMRMAGARDWRALISDGGNMAAYYLFLKAWLNLGNSEWVVRLPSVVFSAVGAGLLFLLARRLFERRVAATATLLLVVNSSFVRYGQEARSYALELMVITAAWLVLAVALERRTIRWFLLWGLLNALAVATQLFAVFFIPAQLASLLLLPLRDVPWKGLLVGLGVYVAGAAPSLAVAAGAGSVYIDWVPPLSMAGFRQALLFLGGANFEPSPDAIPQVISVAALVAGALGWGAGAIAAAKTALRSGRSFQAWSYGMAVMWLFVPLAGAALVSATVQPLMVPRYFIGLVPAGCLLLSVALSRLRRQGVFSTALVLLVALGLSGVVRSDRTGEWGWRRAVTSLLKDARPGDAVVVLPSYARMPLDYYLERSQERVGLDFVSPRQWTWRPGYDSVFGAVEAFYAPSPPGRAADLAAKRPSFWLVTTDLTRWDASGRVVEAWADAGVFFRRLGPGHVVRSGKNFARVGVLQVVEGRRGSSASNDGVRQNEAGGRS